MDESMKEIYFDQYCKTCKNEKVAESEDPCFDCLAEGARPESHKPVHWEEK